MIRKKSIVIVFVGVLLMLLVVQGATAFSSPGRQNTGFLENGSDDDNPTASPEVVIPERYQPRGSGAAQAQNVADVYFTPQDQSTSTTVLFLYNTDTISHTATVETFQLDGTTALAPTNILIPAGELVRICADDVSTISGSWQEVVVLNFTTTSAYGKLSLPQGVKAEGYVAWNNAVTYDPIADQNTLPLRFSTDPASVFLPITQNNN